VVEAQARSGVFEAVPDLEEVARELGFGEGDVVDADALADEAEVGGGVEADFPRVPGEDGRDEGGGGALALGAGDVDGV
jgi:hypothetical protein